MTDDEDYYDWYTPYLEDYCDDGIPEDACACWCELCGPHGDCDECLEALEPGVFTEDERASYAAENLDEWDLALEDDW